MKESENNIDTNNEEFQKAMKDYFEGNCDKDTAIETFKKAVIEKYPDLAE